MHPELGRFISRLRIVRQRHFGGSARSPIPDLLDPTVQAFMSDRGMMITGFEEIGRQRYYQGWYIQWID